MLQEGDVIELMAGMKVYADIPEHFVYANRRGSFALTRHAITLGGEFDYLCGKYIVYKTTRDGGRWNDNENPNGHHVFCMNVQNGQVRVDFYQSGFFAAMIKDIVPLSRATLRWTVDAGSA